MKNLKQRTLSAMQVILQEYREKRHKAAIYYCPLCSEFYYGNNPNGERCQNCPMDIFKGKRKNKYSFNVGCLRRKCAPIYCHDYTKMTKTLKRVIEFYEKAIEVLKNVKDEDFTKDCFQRLIAIDEEIYKKYKKQPNENS
jgi:hypothetical protein